jgi:hypothetical protein
LFFCISSGRLKKKYIKKRRNNFEKWMAITQRPEASNIHPRKKKNNKIEALPGPHKEMCRKR